jgi:hypothetical protein
MPANGGRKFWAQRPGIGRLDVAQRSGPRKVHR